MDISGAVFRYFEHNDDRWYRLLQQNFWKSSTQQEETFVKLIDAWEEKDAESIEPFDSTEPTLMTQSQRIPDRNSE